MHLEIGEPDFDTAPHIVDAAVAAMRDGMTHYCPAAGLDDFRESIARYFKRTRGVDVDPANCLVATGAKPFLFFTVLACCNPGDEVIYPDPGFPIYESAIRWAGAVPVPLELREEESFSLDPERLAALLSPRTKLVILNYPQNPTGGTLDRAAVEASLQSRDVDGLDPRRRDLLAAAVRRPLLEHHELRLAARAHARPRRTVEDLRDDRLALRLRRGARSRWSSRSSASSSTRPRAFRRSCSRLALRRSRGRRTPSPG